MAVSKMAPHPSPKTYLEQYTITPEVAAEILYMATYTYDDICNKAVIDLGCGTGRLAIIAALLGAKEVIGVDIDRPAIKQAVKNAKQFDVGARVNWVIADIDAIHGSFDTVLQNPPFGVQKKGADRKFLEKALQIGKHIYSLHKGIGAIKKQRGYRLTLETSPSHFLKRFIEKNGGEILAVYSFLMNIPHMFPFHQKHKHQFAVNLYVITRKG
jgi:putative methylase